MKALWVVLTHLLLITFAQDFSLGQKLDDGQIVQLKEPREPKSVRVKDPKEPVLTNPKEPVLTNPKEPKPLLMKQFPDDGPPGVPSSITMSEKPRINEVLEGGPPSALKSGPSDFPEGETSAPFKELIENGAPGLPKPEPTSMKFFPEDNPSKEPLRGDPKSEPSSTNNDPSRPSNVPLGGGPSGSGTPITNFFLKDGPLKPLEETPGGDPLIVGNSRSPPMKDVPENRPQSSSKFGLPSINKLSGSNSMGTTKLEPPSTFLEGVPDTGKTSIRDLPRDGFTSAEKTGPPSLKFSDGGPTGPLKSGPLQMKEIGADGPPGPLKSEKSRIKDVMINGLPVAFTPEPPPFKEFANGEPPNPSKFGTTGMKEIPGEPPGTLSEPLTITLSGESPPAPPESRKASIKESSDNLSIASKSFKAPNELSMNNENIKNPTALGRSIPNELNNLGSPNTTGQNNLEKISRKDLNEPRFEDLLKSRPEVMQEVSGDPMKKNNDAPKFEVEGTPNAPGNTISTKLLIPKNEGKMGPNIGEIDNIYLMSPEIVKGLKQRYPENARKIGENSDSGMEGMPRNIEPVGENSPGRIDMAGLNGAEMMIPLNADIMNPGNREINSNNFLNSDPLVTFSSLEAMSLNTPGNMNPSVSRDFTKMGSLSQGNLKQVDPNTSGSAPLMILNEPKNMQMMNFNGPESVGRRDSTFSETVPKMDLNDRSSGQKLNLNYPSNAQNLGSNDKGSVQMLGLNDPSSAQKMGASIFENFQGQGPSEPGNERKVDFNNLERIHSNVSASIPNSGVIRPQNLGANAPESPQKILGEGTNVLENTMKGSPSSVGTVDTNLEVVRQLILPDDPNPFQAPSKEILSIGPKDMKDSSNARATAFLMDLAVPFPQPPKKNITSSDMNSTQRSPQPMSGWNATVLAPAKPGDGPAPDDRHLPPSGQLTKPGKQVKQPTCVIPLPAAANEFLLPLLRLLPQDTDLLVSPLSMSVVLSMAYHGARGQTARQMEGALKFEKYKLKDATVTHGFVDILATLPEASDDCKLLMANDMFVQKNYAISPGYIADLMAFFAASVQNVDFVNDGLAVINQINSWVADKTMNTIQKVFTTPLGSPEAMLVSVAYFKGIWKIPFPKEDTKEQDFFKADGKRKKIPMMTIRNERFRYVEDEKTRYQFLELPYKDKNLNMLLALPNKADNPPDLQITSELLCQVNASMKTTKMAAVVLPKFRLDFQAQLKETLLKMGIGDLFDARKANMSAVSTGLSVGAVFHKAVLEVDEEGEKTLILAADRKLMAALSSRDSNPPSFIANHPFLLFITDRRNGLVLFAGRLINPSS